MRNAEFSFAVTHSSVRRFSQVAADGRISTSSVLLIEGLSFSIKRASNRHKQESSGAFLTILMLFNNKPPASLISCNIESCL